MRRIYDKPTQNYISLPFFLVQNFVEVDSQIRKETHTPSVLVFLMLYFYIEILLVTYLNEHSF